VLKPQAARRRLKTTIAIDERKFEFGVLFTSLMRDGDGDRNGFGGRIGYDAFKFGGGKYVVTAEGEVSYLPGVRFVGNRRDGRILQGFVGTKIGRRFEKLGVFGKVRPGFVRYSQGKQSVSGTFPNITATTSSETNFATD
jgi:hypothetical protein